MGTFVQAAAFIDALSLAYSAPPVPKVRGSAAKWRRFVERYFPPGYAPIADAYDGFRCLLLHNFSASSRLGFTHDEPKQHLQVRIDGRVMLDRGSLIAAVTHAFDAFERDVLAEEELGVRVLAWLDRHPPLGFWTSNNLLLTPSQALTRVGLSLKA